jgi:hypothetical protein
MFWLRWLSVLTGALSIYSVGIHVYRLPLTDTFQYLLGYYRAVFYPVADVINYLVAMIGIRWSIPNDILIMYLLLGASFARFDVYSHSSEGVAASPKYIRIPVGSTARNDEPKKGPMRTRIDSVLYLIAPFLFVITWPFVFIVFISMAFEKGNAGYWSKQILRYVTVGMCREVFKVIVLFFLFIIINAASPSLF